MGETRIFVYGSLLRGEPNHRQLKNARFLGSACTAPAFDLVVVGAYPALVHGGGTAVKGELYGVDDATRATLDRFEGHPELYQRGEIALADGTVADAYVMPRAARERFRTIASGSWRAWCRRAVVAMGVLLGVAGHASAERRHRDAGADVGAPAPTSAVADIAPPAADAPDAQPPAPAPTASAVQQPVPEGQGAAVKLRDARVFTVRIPLGAQTAEDRARAASQALQKVVETNEPPNVRVDIGADVAIVYVGERPIIQLVQNDALAAGDASLGVHANSIAAKVRDGLAVEQKQRSLLKIGLTVLGDLIAGILALFLLRRVGRLSRATRSWLTEQHERVPSLTVQSIELVRPSTLRMVLLATVRVLAILLQIGIAYGWLILALYSFEQTREYTWRFTEIALTPLSGLMAKMATSVPTLVLASVSLAALFLLVRFVGAYFEGAARGETAIGWVSPDLAAATSLVVRFAIVVLFLVVAIPFITGTEDSSLARVGLIAIVALGLASTPLLASMCVGIAVVYGRGLHAGEFVSFGPHAGRIDTISLLELRLRDNEGCEIRIPHLLSLFYPVRIFGKARPVSATITVAASASQRVVRELLVDTAMGLGTEPALELLSLDGDGASYRVTVRSEEPRASHRLYCALGDALADRSIPLGRAAAKA